MSFTRNVDLVINLAAGTSGPLLKSTATLADRSKPVWNQGDKFTLRLWFCQPGETQFAPLTVTALDAGAVIALGARLEANQESGALLFSATAFTAVTDAGGLTHYEAPLDLNTAELVTALTGKKTIDAKVDVEIQNAGNTERITIPKFTVSILRDTYRGTEGVPVAGNPVYPVPSAIELVARKGQPNGYAGLDSDGKVPAAQLPAGIGNSLTQLDGGSAVSTFTPPSIDGGVA